ncbi:hypothetical protein BROUX41_003565 [Berkeleyomyces rouxiae]|uniref:uncharacterized protein n=1 Tax=Berkeleyomyces rouxiae TaxID=2035830 RepID=UPI003B816FFE
MPGYKSTPLYGGAIVADLPAGYVDVSTIRSVPDHQEVFLDSDGFTSIVIELNERIGAPVSSAQGDADALTQHLMDLVGEESKDCVRVWSSAPATFSKVDSKYPAYTLIATDASPARPGNRKPPVFTALIMTMVRVEDKDTDILITANVPHIKGEYDEAGVDLDAGKQGPLITRALEYAEQIQRSFDIRDYSLFGSD